MMRLIRYFVGCTALMSLTSCYAHNDGPAVSTPDTIRAPIADQLGGDTAGVGAPQIKRQFVDGPYGQVHLRIARPAQPTTKPPLILFHPTPYSGDYFAKFMLLMARDRMVVAIDTPGYGDSAAPDGAPTIAGYAASAKAALGALKLAEDGQRPVDLFGYHTGTLVAIELAAQYPQAVRRIVLPGLPFFTGKDRTQAYARDAKPDPIERSGAHLQQKWKFSSSAVDNGLSLARAQSHFNDGMQCYPNCWRGYQAVFSYESEKRIAKVTQPALLITTSGSLKNETEAAAPLFAQSKTVHLGEITYGGFDLQTGLIADATRTFLDSDRDPAK